MDARTSSNSPIYSVPAEAKKLFESGILQNAAVSDSLPKGLADAAQCVTFEGSDLPSIPVNWRFAESIAALKACEAAVLNILLGRKYGIQPARITINTDHAQLFILSFLLWTLDPEGDDPLGAHSMVTREGRAKLAAYFPSWDKRWSSSGASDEYYSAATNIYRTKDGKYFHVHASMDPNPTIASLGLPEEMDCPSTEAARQVFGEAVTKFTAEELERVTCDVYRQAGTICWTTDEYMKSVHGRANSHVGLFEMMAHGNARQSPGWWQAAGHMQSLGHGAYGDHVSRPLAGLKVVELTRVIAGPVVGRGLAELGASVMRITAAHLPDISTVHLDTNHGKWNACLDLRLEADRETLRRLVLDADVFLQSYRPGALDKYGFGENDVIDMCRSRDRGIIYVAVNSYGWQGPWANRSGWQQISDANCGVSYEFGRAMGLDEPVTPIFPNSDYCTGVVGVISVITALLRQADEGGSYSIHWLVNSCSVYPDSVWKEVWQRHGSPVFRHYHSMQHTLPRTIRHLYSRSGETLFRPDFFTDCYARHLAKTLRIVAPVLRFPDGQVSLGFHVGTRTNGVDKPRWPDDLSVEVIE